MKNQKFIIRTVNAGVFFAEVINKSYTGAGCVVELANCRRLWHWSGAASLSELATNGVKRPHDCKFTVVVPSMEVIGAIEIIPCTDKAVESINGVAEWRA